MFVDLPLAIDNLQCFIRSVFPPAAGEQEVEGNPGKQDIASAVAQKRGSS